MDNAGSFKNESLIDWARTGNQATMRQNLKKVGLELGKNYPLLINGQQIFVRKQTKSLNPANFWQTVGQVSCADASLVDRAVEAAWNAWPSWCEVAPRERAEILFRGAQAMRDRRYELAAWAVFEVGKSWQEADGDIAEAIDFLEFYGRRMIDIGEPRPTDEVMGEINKTVYASRGVIAVLGVWNFPFAINIGMCAAAIVTGNTVVFKPSSLSAVIGYKIVEILHEAGLPDGVLNFLPGPGVEVGEGLVAHPDVIGVAVTSSKETGLRIAQVCVQHPCRYGFKEIIAGEFGGKDKIIVDSDADIDEAVKGVLHSWLGYQGQKCSACSVVIALDAVYERFLTRLIEAAKSINIGSPQDPGNFMGPVISEDALKKIQQYVAIGKSEGRLAYAGCIDPSLYMYGYYHPPVIFADVDPQAVIAQEEIFGPVLTVIKAEDFNEAVRIFNDSQYALTGGIFSRFPPHIERAMRECNVGNLYINRKITGALVRRQPFGGWKFSGVGSKAGSRNYLLRFMYEKTITENIIRRGFAPE